tara:strand:+ start:402772 stop:403728 length:957 start_codon:yes stop_codon:yes gene_type:complete
MTAFNADSTTKDVIAGRSLLGKTAVVTGASAGLGVETARTLASAGANVVLVARSASKLEPVLETLREELPQAEFDSVLVDLADLDSVRRGSAELLSRHSTVHLLINNAGVMACPLARTAQDFELQFGTNHLGHFLLTVLLAPALQNAAAQCRQPSRVVALSSSGHRFGGIHFDDPNYRQRDYDKWEAYGQSKTANALFAVGLDARMKDAGVRAFAVHPGMILTELGRHLQQEDYDALMARMPKGVEPKFKDVEQGAATSVWAATTDELEGRGGLYLEDCHIADSSGELMTGGIADYAIDPAAADRLWQLSEELVGQAL